jgi:hypothetical protein
MLWLYTLFLAVFVRGLSATAYAPMLQCSQVWFSLIGFGRVMASQVRTEQMSINAGCPNVSRQLLFHPPFPIVPGMCINTDERELT